MSVESEAEQVAEIVETAIVTASETPTEVESQIAVIKAEAAVERAVEAAATLEAAANLEIAAVTLNAEERIEEHENKVNELSWSNEWAQERINYLERQVSELWEKLASLQSTPMKSEQVELPPTVEVVTETSQVADEVDPAEQLENLPPVIQKAQRKIRVL